MMDDRELLSFEDRDEWRAWLASNHDRATEAWIVIYKKSAREVALTLDEAQGEALCFGWVDVMSRRVDDARYALRFTPRRAGSLWSLTNIRHVERLIAAGRMTEAGMVKIDEAKQNGQWEAALASERTDVIPADLEKALRRRKGALAGYKKLTDSRKRQILHQLLSAKNPATRQRRIEAIVQHVLPFFVLHRGKIF